MRGGDDGTRERGSARLWVIAALAVGVVVAGIVLGLRVANAGAEPEGQNWWLVAQLVIGLAYLPAGALLASRPDHRRLGVLFLVVGLTALLNALATQYLGYAEAHGDPVAWPGLASLASWRWAVGGAVLATLVILALLPGRWRSDPRRSVLGAAALAGIVALVVHQLTAPWPEMLGSNPLEVSSGWPSRAIELAGRVGRVTVDVVALAALALLAVAGGGGAAPSTTIRSPPGCWPGPGPRCWPSCLRPSPASATACLLRTSWRRCC